MSHVVKTCRGDPDVIATRCLTATRFHCAPVLRPIVPVRLLCRDCAARVPLTLYTDNVANANHPTRHDMALRRLAQSNNSAAAPSSPGAPVTPRPRAPTVHRHPSFSCLYSVHILFCSLRLGSSQIQKTPSLYNPGTQWIQTKQRR